MPMSLFESVAIQESFLPFAKLYMGIREDSIQYLFLACYVIGIWQTFS